MRSSILNVNGKSVSLKELTYSDLVWLFNDYISKNGYVPTQKECKTANNLPHGRVINRILNEVNITYNDFLNQFGKVKHVRTESNDYDFYLDRYKQISKELGHGLKQIELTNNCYGLPSASWFVKYCPEKSVKNYNDFVIWCGFESNELRRDKEEISKILINLEKELGRPIIRDDIKKDTVGFSMIVIVRIWGGLNNCKKELGLMKTLPTQPKPFEYYKSLLDDFIIRENIVDRGFVSWKEIEKGTNVEHKTLIKTFENNGGSIYQYLASLKITLNPNGYGYSKLLESGEKVISSMEYKFSTFLEDQGIHFNQDYKRDVLYRTFLPYGNKSKMNCDYVIWDDYYVEVAGLISNKNNDWDTREYKYKKHDAYQKKMILKRQLLEDNNKRYLFLFPEDFDDESYTEKFYEFIGRR